ncbi:MAG: Maf family protein [Candidatus Peregrinibacteria bacterium]|nr:Maf family protein [Candidatus Peregrinibacteria bacterium]
MLSPLILASASPQRSTLLKSLGVVFEVISSTIEERSCTESDPAKRSMALALMKAKDVAGSHPKAWIIGCDTLVVADDGILLEKPRDADDARRMLRLQSGRTSTVHSGLTLLSPKGESWTDISSSRVTFKELSNADVEWWIATGQWEGRSGAFQIDGLGQLMIVHLDGDWTSVVGLPVFLLGELAERAGERIV